MSDSDSDDGYYDYSSLIYQYDSEEDMETREMRLEDEWCERELQKRKRNGFQPTEDEALKFDEVRRQIEANDPNVLPSSITWDDRFCLTMSSDFWPYDGDWSSAGRAIANNEYLKELYVGDYRDPAHEMNTNTEEQFTTFWGLVSAGSTSITKLSLCNYSLLGGSEFFTLMGNFIGKQIVELHIDKADMNDEGASVFASTLSKGNVLQTLSIGGSVSVDPWCYRGSGGADPLTNEGWKSIVGCLQSPHCKITSLSISESTMDDSTASILANGLKNNPYLKKLLMGSKGVTNSGWQAIFSALETNSALEQLSLSRETSWLRPDPGLDEGVVTTLVNSLTSNRTLKSLNVMKFTKEGLRSFIPLFRSPHSTLEEFRSTDTLLTIELAALLASSLIGNTKLKRLVLEHNNDNNAAVQILGTFLGIVCNKLNIMATYQSNHTLQEIGGTRYMSRNHEVYSMLQVNKNSNSLAAAARSKIIKTHFSDVNVKEFVDMDEEVYPQAAAWMAKDIDGLSLLYKFLTSIPLDLDGYAAFAKAGYDLQSKKKRKLVSSQGV